MSDPLLKSAFRTAVTHTGEPYRTARQEVLNQGASASPLLRAEQSSPDWNVALTAIILAGWLEHKAAFDQCTDAIKGNFSGRRPITGEFLPKQRITVVVHLGKVVTPRLLEMVLKTHEYGSTAESASIFGSLAGLKDERTVLPLIEVVTSPAYPETVRELAASSLAELRDRRTIAPLRTLLENASEPEMLRATAAMSLGSLGATEAVPELRSLVSDQKAGMDLRKTAVRVLARMGDRQSADLLLAEFARTQDLVYQLTLLNAVGDLGSHAHLSALKAIEGKNHDSNLREAAREAREAIETRGGTGKE